MTLRYEDNYVQIQSSPVHLNRSRPAFDCVHSELLSLAFTSDVDDPREQQLERGQLAISLRQSALDRGWDGKSSDHDAASAFLDLCSEIVNDHLMARSSYYGAEQTAPFDNAQELASDGRDIFLIIKFMDEEPHIRSTVNSLLAQRDLDLSRVVIVGVDNMSSDNSGKIFQEMRDANTSAACMIYCQQTVSGGGSAARYGVDRSIATIREMVRQTGDVALYHRARIAVSDGDTVYHPGLVANATDIFDTHNHIDGVMPFLTYKLSACLRLFHGWMQRDVSEILAALPDDETQYVDVPFTLDNIDAYDHLPRKKRKLTGESMALETQTGESIAVSFIAVNNEGIRFGVLRDPDGNRAFIFEDRFLILERAPVSGFDSALVYLENKRVTEGEIWRWHSLIGHDLFLLWSFIGMGLRTEFILPDTSDALKSFRVWAFAIGGQHQLSRPGTKRVTGTDYQSGRVLQCFGAQTVLGNPAVHSETEIDRLAKMIRNFANEQSVFYGNTRAGSLERASGLYLHMTKIQNQIEAEVRDYSEALYRGIVFPERILFPLRWIMQNLICAYSCASMKEKPLVTHQGFLILMGKDSWDQVRTDVLTDEVLRDLSSSSFEVLKGKAEALSEQIICAHWDQFTTFYEETLRRFFEAHSVDEDAFEFLLSPLSKCRNSLLEERPEVDVNDVWSGKDFVVDSDRGQVLEVGTGTVK